MTAEPPAPPPSAAEKKGGLWREVGHGLLDLAGLVPGLGEPADLANAVWYGAAGDKVNAALSTTSAIPVAGWGAAGAKLGRKGLQAAEGGNGARNVVNSIRLRSQLAGDEIAGGHAFEKHVQQGEFPGVETREQFARHIEDVIANGEVRSLSAGRSAYWRDGTIVIRNPKSADGRTAFKPRDGYDYFSEVP